MAKKPGDDLDPMERVLVAALVSAIVKDLRDGGMTKKKTGAPDLAAVDRKMARDDGGFVFPQLGVGGMNLRDAFALAFAPAVYAAAVASGNFLRPRSPIAAFDEQVEAIVTEMYALADAAIAERAK
jgi:hypothetical protein